MIIRPSNEHMKSQASTNIYNTSTLPRLLDTLIDTRTCRSILTADKAYEALGFMCDEDSDKINVNYALDGIDMFKHIAVEE
jgi:hypothetical protein